MYMMQVVVRMRPLDEDVTGEKKPKIYPAMHKKPPQGASSPWVAPCCTQRSNEPSHARRETKRDARAVRTAAINGNLG